VAAPSLRTIGRRYDRAMTSGEGAERRGGRLLDVDDCALCVVDVQPGFVEKLGSDADARGIVERIAWIVDVALRMDVPIVVTEEEPDRNRTTVPPVLERLPADVRRLTKPVFCLADVPEIMSAVDATRRRTAVLVGLETDVCVSQSALGLLDRGYRVAAVRDATAAPGDAHEAGIDRMRAAGVDVVTTKSLYYEWTRAVERAWTVERSMATVPRPEGLIL
jgi:nicotinamidase-related amidase